MGRLAGFALSLGLVIASAQEEAHSLHTSDGSSFSAGNTDEMLWSEGPSCEEPAAEDVELIPQIENPIAHPQPQNDTLWRIGFVLFFIGLVGITRSESDEEKAAADKVDSSRSCVNHLMTPANSIVSAASLVTSPPSKPQSGATSSPTSVLNLHPEALVKEQARYQMKVKELEVHMAKEVQEEALAGALRELKVKEDEAQAAKEEAARMLRATTALMSRFEMQMDTESRDAVRRQLIQKGVEPGASSFGSRHLTKHAPQHQSSVELATLQLPTF